MTDTTQAPASWLPDVRTWSWTGLAKVIVAGVVMFAGWIGYRSADEIKVWLSTAHPAYVTRGILDAELKAISAKIPDPERLATVAQTDALAARIKALEEAKGTKRK